jgi:hypothetical protein
VVETLLGIEIVDEIDSAVEARELARERSAGRPGRRRRLS